VSDLLTERCEAVRADLVRTAHVAGIQHDPIGQVIQAQAEFAGLLPLAVSAIRTSQPAGVAAGVRKAVEEGMRELRWMQARKFLAVMVVGGISLVLSAAGAGFLIGRGAAQHDVTVLGRAVAIDGSEAREWSRLIEANAGSLSASIRDAQVWRDEKTGRDVVRVTLWRSMQTTGPAAR